ncbi:MAG: ATP-grasp domain-containing protein [Actinomycetota bacterium]|nr:ATP-grasp domain-containing protein [Actinomycetota bacterium]
MLVAREPTTTNTLLLTAVARRGLRAELLEPEAAIAGAGPGTVVLGRIDVRPTLDGPEPGWWELRRLERRGAVVLNRAATLLAAHDKLATAVRLATAGIPHPATACVYDCRRLPGLKPPVVVKPRFGSWGRDVFRCDTRDELAACLASVNGRSWFRNHGALVQELVPASRFDLRVVVAGGSVVGAVRRVAAPGEWRTNVALGGQREGVARIPAGAAALALAAARTIRGDLVGVDLLPVGGGGYVVLEINGAVDFTVDYSLGGENVFDAAADALLARIDREYPKETGAGSAAAVPA